MGFARGAIAAVIAATASLLPFGVQAATIAFTDTVDPEPNLTISDGHSYGYSHSIPNFLTGDVVTDAILSITLSDNGGSERIKYEIDGYVSTQNNTGNAAQTYVFNFGTLGILGELADGVLSVTLSETDDDKSYIFNQSVLTGHLTRTDDVVLLLARPAPVPEPASVALIGVGLAGLAAARRKKK